MNREAMEYVVYMIHKCAHAWGMSPAQVYEKLNLSGCIQNDLVPHYDVLHTQSAGYVLEDIQAYLQKRGILYDRG